MMTVRRSVRQAQRLGGVGGVSWRGPNRVGAAAQANGPAPTQCCQRYTHLDSFINRTCARREDSDSKRTSEEDADSASRFDSDCW